MKILAGIVIGAAAVLFATGSVSVNCADFAKNYYCAVKTPWSFTIARTP